MREEGKEERCTDIELTWKRFLGEEEGQGQEGPELESDADYLRVFPAASGWLRFLFRKIYAATLFRNRGSRQVSEHSHRKLSLWMLLDGRERAHTT